MTSYSNPYSIYPISPSQYGYQEIILTGNSTFSWPENNADSKFIIAQQMYVSTSNTGNQFIFPPANLVGTGRTFQIFNFGVLAFTIYDNDSNSLAIIEPGQLYQCTVTSNSSPSGNWGILLLGVGTSGADASALSGYGLSALTNSKINTNLPEKVITTAYTVVAADRGSILSYTGGTNTITLPNPVNGFIVGVINNSTIGGLLTIQAPTGFTINNDPILTLPPGDSCFITGGANYNAIGIGNLSINNDSLLQLDVSASGDITLTPAQSSSDIIIFTGTLANNIHVYFVPAQVNIYNIYNNTTGGFNITISILGGANTYILQNQQRYAYFTNVSELYDVPNNLPSDLAKYWVSSSSPSLPNQVNLGTLANGLVAINVVSAVATPYTMPIVNNSTTGNFFFGANSIPNPSITGDNNTIIGIGSGSLLTTGNRNVGIGSSALTISTTGSDNIGIGVGALAANTTGNRNVGIGSSALFANINGQDNIGIGNDALAANTIGDNNVGIGSAALLSNTTGGDNVGVGVNALAANTSGGANIGVGVNALFTNTTGHDNLGIGTSTLKLNTTGNNNVGVGSAALFSNTTGGDNVAIGYSALASNTIGGANIGVGTGALGLNTTGSGSVAVGVNALVANTTGGNNVGVGSAALTSNTTGSENVAIGTDALFSNTTGRDNIGVGVNALELNTIGDRNVGIGTNTLGENTTGGDNVGVGYSALELNTTGGDNVAIGSNTLESNTVGGGNVGVGSATLGANTTGNNNVGVGVNVLSTNINGSNNVGVGTNALESNTTGIGNLGIGINALESNTTGIGNLGIGTSALSGNITGSNNVGINSASGFSNNNSCIFIGVNSDSTTGGLTNAIAIGANAQVSNSNTMILGSPGTAVGVNSLANLVVTANSRSNGTVGTATLNGITNVVVNTTACKTTSIVITTPLTNATPANNGTVTVNNITNGSFQVVSTNALDNSTVQWFVINPV